MLHTNLRCKPFSLFIMTLVTLLSVGCFTTQQAPVPHYSATFDYTPPTRAEAKSSGLSIAIVNPQYTEAEGSNLPPYSDMANSLGDDFEEMLIAKGYSIRGPFKSRDEMVYGDKKDSDLVLSIDIDLEMEKGTFGYRNVSIYGGPRYKYGGTFYHKGKIVLTLTSPFKAEKLWKKSIQLDRVAIAAQGTSAYGQLVSYEELLKDQGISGPVGKALESYYENILDLGWRHLEPEELKSVARESVEIDSK